MEDYYDRDLHMEFLAADPNTEGLTPEEADEQGLTLDYYLELQKEDQMMRSDYFNSLL